MAEHEAGAIREPVRKRVGGSLSRLPPLQRLEALRRSARALPKTRRPDPSDGIRVRKVVGAPR
jgi:hypothetical protein